MKFLLVENDDRIAAAQHLVLHRHGVQVTRAATGAYARKLLITEFARFDVIILDLDLPDTDAITLCRDIRAVTDTPVLANSIRSHAGTRAYVLHQGADDFLSKPYDLRELLDRVQALLRRHCRTTAGTAAAPEALTGSTEPEPDLA